MQIEVLFSLDVVILHLDALEVVLDLSSEQVVYLLTQLLLALELLLDGLEQLHPKLLNIMLYGLLLHVPFERLYYIVSTHRVLVVHQVVEQLLQGSWELPSLDVLDLENQLAKTLQAEQNLEDRIHVARRAVVHYPTQLHLLPAVVLVVDLLRYFDLQTSLAREKRESKNHIPTIRVKLFLIVLFFLVLLRQQATLDSVGLPSFKYII